MFSEISALTIPQIQNLQDDREKKQIKIIREDRNQQFVFNCFD